MNKIMLGILASGALLSSSESIAAAFQLAEQSVSGLGRAYAGEAAVADDASVVARNPALMTEFSGTHVSGAVMYVLPDVSLSGTTTPYGLPESTLDDDSIAPSAIVPAAFFMTELNDKWHVGIGSFSNFGLATKFDEDYVAGQIAGETEILTVNTSVTAAYEVNEALSVAFGVNHIYADAKIQRRLGVHPVLSADTEVLNLEGDDHSYGWNAGISWSPDETSRFGLSYRSESDINFSGTYSNGLPSIVPGSTAGKSLPGGVDITLPAIAEFSGSHQLNPQFALHYSALWTGWSSFKSLSAEVEGLGTVFTKEENFSNSWRFSVGGDYNVSEDIKLRAGLAYDESPADEDHMSISIPDTNRVWYAFGMEYHLSDKSSIDLGLTLIRGEKQRFVEDGWGFESKGHASVVGIQYNHRF